LNIQNLKIAANSDFRALQSSTFYHAEGGVADRQPQPHLICILHCDHGIFDGVIVDEVELIESEITHGNIEKIILKSVSELRRHFL
jgi:hypothetical protein